MAKKEMYNFISKHLCFLVYVYSTTSYYLQIMINIKNKMPETLVASVSSSSNITILVVTIIFHNIDDSITNYMLPNLLPTYYLSTANLLLTTTYPPTICLLSTYYLLSTYLMPTYYLRTI
jgi:hypothetical protein